MFVDLRHEATHGEMPSLVVLREACEGALKWLWVNHWKALKGSKKDGKMVTRPRLTGGDWEGMQQQGSDEAEIVDEKLKTASAVGSRESSPEI